jgi:CubicO group peptidase (beta-lactamase class C family)/acetyl esterase/lipase/esterase/lipase superfamily enzyme
VRSNTLCHAVLWVATATLALAQQNPAISGLAERFRQLDKNGDGTITREEGGSLPFFEPADKDRNGVLTFAEAEMHARQETTPARNRTAGMEGDGAGPMSSRVKPVEVPETESRIQTLDAKAADGRAVRAFWRKPRGDGPFPAIVFIHGGLTQVPEEVLRRQLQMNPVIARLLDAGYGVVQATFRTYEQDVQSRAPIEDVRAVVHALAKAPRVDSKRIALFGGSGGGSIALELGSDPAVRAVIAGEPATVLYTGMLTTGEYGPRLEIMAAPEKYFTPELRQRTLEKLKTLHALVLMLHSDQHALHKLNKPLFLPLMKEAGVKVEYREYPGYGHGFYLGGGDDRWGKGADEAVVEAVVRDTRAFLDESMPATAAPRPSASAPAWVTPEVTAPRVQFRTFDSEAVRTKVSYHIYTPACYDTEKERRFPVVYWLHGSGGGLAGIPQLARHFDTAIESGHAPPFLVVFVNGLVEGMYVDWKDHSTPVETVIVKDLVPHIDATWRTIAAREGRMLDGFSMGGYGAARLGFKYPEMFRVVSIVGAGPMQPELVQAPRAGRQRAAEVLQKVYGGDQAYFRSVSPRTLAERNAAAITKGSLVRLVIGDKDETFENNRAFHEHLESLKIPHGWTVLGGVAHDPMGVLRALGDDNWAFYRAAFGPGEAPASGEKAIVDPKLHPGPHGDQPNKAALKPDVLAKLDLALEQAVANKEVSGVIGLIHHNGERGYFKAFGWQVIEARKPLAKDAIFRLQSMSKPVVAACAMALYDQGLFTLDEPISKHCPEWAAPKVLENGQLVPAKFAITSRMLMSHSSGLYYGEINGGPPAARSAVGRTSLKALSESLAQQPLKFHPGTGWQYGHSIDILGRYIEAVEGKPLDEVLQERILGPLKMTSTDFWVHPENAGRICQIYKQPKPGVLERGREAAQLTEKPTLFLGGQGLCSSTEDYERFCRMLVNRGELDGVRVLKPESVDLMFQNHLKPELGQKYGLGGAVDGEGGYSWGGANGTQFWIDRENNLFALFMVQTQIYRAPTYGAFRNLVNEAAGIVSRRDSMGGMGLGGGNRVFQQRDTNNDGKLSRDEIPGALFDRLDANKDGFLTEEEAKALWNKRQPEMKP